jgi:hypothetical protein
MQATARHAGGRPRKEIDAGELRRLLEEGRSLRQIAAQLGRGYGSVHRAAKALGHDALDPKLAEAIQNPAA